MPSRLGDFVSRGISIAKKDARIYYFKPQIFGFGILIPCFVYLSFSLGRQIPNEVLIPGLVAMISLFSASSIEAIAIPIERQTGTYELLQMAPLTTATIVFGKSLAGSAFGVVLSLLTAIGAMLLTASNIVNPFLFALAVIVGACAFSALGMLVAAAAKDMPTANISLTAIRLSMIFIGGVFQPVQTYPLQLRIISYLTPLSYLVDALQEAMVATDITFVVDLAAMLAWFIVLQMLAIMVLNRRQA